MLRPRLRSPSPSRRRRAPRPGARDRAAGRPGTRARGRGWRLSRMRRTARPAGGPTDAARPVCADRWRGRGRPGGWASSGGRCSWRRSSAGSRRGRARQRRQRGSGWVAAPARAPTPASPRWPRSRRALASARPSGNYVVAPARAVPMALSRVRGLVQDGIATIDRTRKMLALPGPLGQEDPEPARLGASGSAAARRRRGRHWRRGRAGSGRLKGVPRPARHLPWARSDRIRFRASYAPGRYGQGWAGHGGRRRDERGSPGPAGQRADSGPTGPPASRRRGVTLDGRIVDLSVVSARLRPDEGRPPETITPGLGGTLYVVVSRCGTDTSSPPYASTAPSCAPGWTASPSRSPPCPSRPPAG